MLPVFREAAVDSPDAHRLLTDYFAARADGFDRAAGSYRVTFPSPEHFTGAAGAFLLLDHDGDAVGCGGVRLLSPERAEVKHLFVRDAARGLGLGRALLHELEERARALGATETVLDTNADLTAAGSLYRRAGYTAIEPYNDNPNANLWLGKTL